MARVVPRHPYLDWPGPIAFAHRGGASEAPENTMPAFRHAMALGYRYLETDVHVTTDGAVMAFHDDDLARTCGRPGRITEMTRAQLRSALVDGREPIPMLDDLFDEFPDARLNIDCKADTATEPLAELLERRGVLDRVCVGAFSDRRLRRLRRRLGPQLCTSAGPTETATLLFSGRVPRGALAVQVPTRRGRLAITTERFVRRAHRGRLAVHVWTIDDRAEIDRLLDLGVDGIITDRPAVLKEALLDRGQWVA